MIISELVVPRMKQPLLCRHCQVWRWRCRATDWPFIKHLFISVRQTYRYPCPDQSQRLSSMPFSFLNKCIRHGQCMMHSLEPLLILWQKNTRQASWRICLWGHGVMEAASIKYGLVPTVLGSFHYFYTWARKTWGLTLAQCCNAVPRTVLVWEEREANDEEEMWASFKSRAGGWGARTEQNHVTCCI